jgi:hypothetical protein
VKTTKRGPYKKKRTPTAPDSMTQPPPAIGEPPPPSIPFDSDVEPGKVWNIDGTDQALTNDEVHRELSAGRIPLGRQVRHVKRGLFKVVQHGHKFTLKRQMH